MSKIILYLILAGAVLFLLKKLLRTTKSFSNSTHKGCGHCGCGKTDSKPEIVNIDTSK